MRLSIKLKVLLCVAAGFYFAASGHCETAGEDEPLNAVYSLAHVFNWSGDNPLMIQIIGGVYAPEGFPAPEGDYLGWGVISGRTWDSLGLKKDRFYKEKDGFIIERNVCILPDLVSCTDINAGNYREAAKGAKLARIKETLTNKRYSLEVLEVMTGDPPLGEIFHLNADANL